jgi:hypothetical protein
MKIMVPLAGKVSTTINAGTSTEDAIVITNTYGEPVTLRGYSFFYKAGLGGAQASLNVNGLRKSTITDDDTPVAAMGCSLEKSSAAGQIAMPWPDGQRLGDGQKIRAKITAPAGTNVAADELFLVFYAELDVA